MACALMGAARADTSPSLSAFTYITEEYPPFNYVERGVHKGQTVELLKRLFFHTQTPFESASIHTYPWQRGYSLTLDTPNTVLFSTTRTAEREAFFDWVGPIAIDRVALIARQNLPFESLGDAIEQNLHVVVIRGDIGELGLTKAGYPERLIHRALDNRSALYMLTNERVDLWAYSASVAEWLARRAGYPSSTLEPVYTLSQKPLYFAINKESDPALVAHFQKALAELSMLDTHAAVYEDE